MPALSQDMPDLEEIAKRVFLQTLHAIEPASVINKALELDNDTLTLDGEEIDLSAYTEVVLIGMGKASVTMAAAVESILGDRVKRGLLVADRRPRLAVRSEVIVAGHPLPDSKSLDAGRRIVELVESCDDHSLIVFLISGGGSSLVELPLSDAISLEDLQLTNRILVGCGATIREINVVRKHLSRIKGGRLGYLARKSQCIALYFSDVNPGDLRSIASNPLLPDDDAPEEFFAVADKFNLIDKLPQSVKEVIARNNAGTSLNWKGKQPVTALLLDNAKAIQGAAEIARRYGFRVEVDSQSIEGEYKRLAEQSIERLLKLKSSFPGERVCVISGGEVSCPVQGTGKGGRNQEFVLYCAALLVGSGIREGAAVLSCGTDGIDGNSKVAGAVASPESIFKAARGAGDALSFIGNNDSYSFFKKMGGLVVTGPTGNNVRDLRILMAQ